MSPPAPGAREVDVAIVGGGLSGLCAARSLHEAGQRVCVLEARDRVGGRTLSFELGGHHFDLGGQWVGPEQHRAHRLLGELGVETFPTWTRGENQLELDGVVSRYDGSIPKISPLKLVELQWTLMRAERLAKRIPPERPWDAPDAETLDLQSLEQWKRENLRSKHVGQLLDSAVRVIFGAEPAEMSLLYFLFYLRSGGGLRPLIETEKGAQQDRLVGGAQQLSEKLAAGLSDDAVLLEAPVHRVVQDADGVKLYSPRGEVRARYAIFALAPALLSRMDFEPGLPARRVQLSQRHPVGATVKCLAFYPAPFWRDRGLSGEVVSSDGPMSVVFDNSSPDGEVACLVGFIVGDEGRRFAEADADQRRERALANFTRFFGPEALRPLEYRDHSWIDEPFSGGCPVSHFAPGNMRRFAPLLRTPVGRLHWAGTETATEWHGFMDGAIQAGERAAQEVLARL